MKRIHLLFLPLLLLASTCRSADPLPTAASAPAPQRHVLLVVMDGLRPDCVTAEDMPTLLALSKRGTFFAHHHPVYLSSTEVNGTAISTGMYPADSGIICNAEFRPDINPNAPVAMEAVATIRAGDKLTNGHYLHAQTIAEILQSKNIPTVIAGTKGVAILHDRKARPDDATSTTLFAGNTLPGSRLADIVTIAGKFPPVTDLAHEPNAPEDTWTVKALTDDFWKTSVPAFTILWLSEPDYSQHATGPFSPVARKALRSSDDRLATVIANLKARNLLDTTDIFVASDHGFSTISRPIDTVVEMRKAGLPAFRSFKEAPKNGDILVAGNGGSVALYIHGHAKADIQGTLDYLQSTDYTGVIFTRDALPGTFKLSDARIDSDAAPDILFSMRWSDAKNRFGLPGEICSDGLGRGAGQGMHVSLSRFDMHNTLIAAGPDIAVGFVDDLPSGNIDLAPTILHLLNVAPPKPMDGRVLYEAFASAPDAKHPPAETKRIEAKATVNGHAWTQYLQQTTYQGRLYLDEGNAQTP